MSRTSTPTDDEAQPERRIHRRGFLAATGGLLATTTAGCLSELGFEEESARAPPLVENRPDAVYHPTHNEGMQMVETKSAGPYRVALSYAFPHRFWTVENEDTSKVTVDRDDSMHLMTSVWHGETGVGVPTAETAPETAARRRLSAISVHGGPAVVVVRSRLSVVRGRPSVVCGRLSVVERVVVERVVVERVVAERVVVDVLSPEARELLDSHVTEHTRLAGESERGVTVVWRRGETESFAASRIGHRSFDGDGTGATGAVSSAVERVCGSVVR